MAEGIIKRFSGGYGFIGRKGQGDLFFHISQWRGSGTPREGQAVVFEEGVGNQGRPAAINVALAGSQPVAVTTTPTRTRQESSPRKQETYPPGYRFLNPYNFVRYLSERPADENAPVEAQLMGRCPPPPHDRWVGLSGRIECQAEAITPVFVSDSEEVETDQNRHSTYRFFNVGGEKMIPASSLRGPVRSVFEAITNSCFATLAEDKRLSYRLDTRDARRLVPARIEKRNGQWALRLLTGTAELNAEQPPNELYAAPVRQYRARKPTGRRPQGPPPPPVEGLPKDPAEWHGAERWAVLMRIKFPKSWRVLAIAGSQEEAEAKKRQEEGKRSFEQPLVVQKGYLCITNQNADNKHSERFFFAQPPQRGLPESIPCPLPVIENYKALITDYQERHERTVKKWRDDHKNPSRPHGEEMAFSRFILNPVERHVHGGEDGQMNELVYAMLSGTTRNPQVLFIAPVSVPRVAYNHVIGELLPDSLHRCKDADNLCPACRTFGWVRGEREQEGAYAGRVRFSHAKLEMPKPEKPMSLAILGSPKPTTTRFYLVKPDRKPAKGQEDHTISYDGNNGRNRLRGRKFYRYYQPDYGPESKQLHAETQSDQNRTIQDAEGPGAIFIFTVTFENLAPAELGALLWALEVGGKGYHRLGYGKPLGLGSLRVTAEEIYLRDFHARYEGLAHDGWSEAMSDAERRHCLTMFCKGMAWAYANEAIREAVEQRGDEGWQVVFEDLPNIKDLLALIGTAEPTLPVHYPFSQDKFLAPERYKGQFEWFVGNKRQKGPKWELALPTEDNGLPLIDKQGTEY